MAGRESPNHRTTDLVTVMTNPVWCRPCWLRECPLDHECMEGIAAASVLDETRRML